MSLSPQINPQTLKFPTYCQIIKWISILTLILPFFFSPSVMVSAQTSTEETQIYTYHVYLPILNEGPQPYFVSPSGNDINPGTFLLPWRTLSKAAHTVKPGDIVYVRGGVYQETVDFITSGTSTAPIRILAYAGETPVIDGNNFSIPGGWGVLLKISGDYIQVAGFEVRYSSAMGVIISGSNDVASQIYSHHNRENGILVSGGYNSTVENCQVWRNALSNEYGLGNGWASGLSVARYGVSYATLRHNIVWENWGEGLSTFEADHIVVEDNIVHDNWGNVYISDSTNILFQRNFVYTDPTSYMYGYGENSGIVMGDELYTPASANITIINNISYGNHGNLWWWQGLQGGGMNNVLIANNTFVNGIGDPNRGDGGVIIDGGEHQNVRFENNIIRQDGNLPIIGTGPNPGITYSHNLWSKTPYLTASGPGDIIADPLFAYTGSQFWPDWYKLTGVSPAVDRALSISEVNVDYFGIYREAPPDMGANEFFPTP